MQIKLSDYIAKWLATNNIKHVFMITGGGAMHLNDSLGKHQDLEVIYNHHEQASAMAAECYARITNRPAAVSVTSGPGGTNAITGVLGAWLDSIPMLIISGQVRYDTTVRSTGLNLRQMGDQEFDIVKTVKSMTKYAVMINDPQSIRYHLERAIFLATTGRPGPCWLDIPLNIQSAFIDEEALIGYEALENVINENQNKQNISEIIHRINKAERPVILAGSAIRSSGAQREFLQLLDLLRIPVVTAWNAVDCVPDDNQYFAGRPGTIGDRPGNFTVQNSDLLISLGCRLNIRQIGYNWDTFARNAFKIIVDIDPLELQKPSIKPDLPIVADVAIIIKELITDLYPEGLSPKTDWIKWCKERRQRYPVVLEEYRKTTKRINPYCFIDVLNAYLPEGQISVAANGTASVCFFQAVNVKDGQRIIANSGCAAMGYDLPAAIGACVASNYSRIVCLAGDGSIQMNIQELQSIAFNKWPIKIFVLNNNGYHSIRQTQENFFEPPLVGCDPASGVGFADIGKVAYAYDIPFIRCNNHEELDYCISKTMAVDEPHICEIMLSTDQPFAPKAASRRHEDGTMASSPLEDMAPFLDRNELAENMIIELIK